MPGLGVNSSSCRSAGIGNDQSNLAVQIFRFEGHFPTWEVICIDLYTISVYFRQSRGLQTVFHNSVGRSIKWENEILVFVRSRKIDSPNLFQYSRSISRGILDVDHRYDFRRSIVSDFQAKRCRIRLVRYKTILVRAEESKTGSPLRHLTSHSSKSRSILDLRANGRRQPLGLIGGSG